MTLKLSFVAWLFALQNKSEERSALLRRLAKLPATEEDKADELSLLARLKLRDTALCISKDPILGLLQDSGTRKASSCKVPARANIRFIF
jgi:hypothetical protein